MNILTIVILAVFVLSIFEGYRKGFLKTAFSLVSWIIILALCEFATPVVTQALVEYTDIEVVVQTTVDAELGKIISDTIDASRISEFEAALPAELKTVLLGESGSLQEIITSGVALDTTGSVKGIVEILGFVVTVIVLRIAMVIIELLLGFVSKLPLIGPMDKILGLACGVGQGLIWCWIILAVVSLLALTGMNTELAAYISQSQLLAWLQDNNVLLNLITNMQ